MTDPELAAIRARLAAATEGPWKVSYFGIGARDGFDDVIAPGPVDCMEYCSSGISTVEATDADWELIAHAPTDLAELCDEVERLRYLLGSHADGHRCTCTMLSTGNHISPPEWEQDPWCPTHPDVDYIKAETSSLRERADAAEARPPNPYENS